MLTHRGFSAWIVSDGKAIPEYLVAEDVTQHRVSCWIPSEAGQSFTVYWRDHGGKIDTCAYITLDGFVVPGRFLFGSGVASRQGVRVGPTTERPFTFQKILEEGGPSPPAVKNAGTVMLRIKRIERAGSRSPNAVFTSIPPPSQSTKAGDMCITYGDEVQTYQQYDSTWSVKPHVSDRPEVKKPSTYVTFVFRYRSRDFLHSQGIITEIKVSAPQHTPVRHLSGATTTEHTPEDNSSANNSLMITPSPSPSPQRRIKSRVPSSSSYALGKGIPSNRQRRPSSDMRRTVSWRAFSARQRTEVASGEYFEEDLLFPKESNENIPHSPDI